MDYNKDCFSCIWIDQCDYDEDCDHHQPISEEALEEEPFLREQYRQAWFEYIREYE